MERCSGAVQASGETAQKLCPPEAVYHRGKTTSGAGMAGGCFQHSFATVGGGSGSSVQQLLLVPQGQAKRQAGQSTPVQETDW